MARSASLNVRHAYFTGGDAETGRIAVTVINHSGDEVLKVLKPQRRLDGQ